ncbi:GDSL-type esterase/lipase family protein [Bradyrhizobium sp. C9]|uniref:SGNH/GDSL hydrolase family protein n=1 Tax=Bradyrhizobium sp. C9 TaxID=142585 RepID=UPI000BE81936|nr:GDSL-type esterase/lipase family protein [Bradyrhizobium sp. C9]PDT74182.1 lysophospholipase [Bradyrhizobium sp. C9]
MIPAQPASFAYPMDRLAGRLAGVGGIKIAAIGSSTTAGEGGIVPYTQRLETALRARHPGRHFDVLNRGVGGEEAPDELRRIDRDVIAERPSVVIWQVGTNAAWKKQDLNATAKAIRDGVARLAESFSDIVLMDLQYLPAVLTDDKIEGAREMVRLIEEAAFGASVPVNLFKRFDLMRQWHETEKISFDRMVDPSDPDRLHQSDWCTVRVAEALADAMVLAAAKAIPCCQS